MVAELDGRIEATGAIFQAEFATLPAPPKKEPPKDSMRTFSMTCG
jgi:hypothetical protein